MIGMAERVSQNPTPPAEQERGRELEQPNQRPHLVPAHATPRNKEKEPKRKPSKYMARLSLLQAKSLSVHIYAYT